MNILVDQKNVELIYGLNNIIDCKLFVLGGNAYDGFDHSNPDLLLIKSSSLTSTIIKNVKERPSLRVVVLNDGNEEGLEDLRKEVGDSFTQMIDLPVFSKELCDAAIKRSEFQCDVCCPEVSDVEDLDLWKFSSAMVVKFFSSKTFWNDSRFCGFLHPVERFSLFKSADSCVVGKDDVLNALYCGCKVLNEDVDEEILKNRSNLHLMEVVLKDCGFTEEGAKVEYYINNQ
jgi:hypothetical protein